MDVAIVSLGAGNVHSLYRAFRRVSGGTVVITDCPMVVHAADRVVVPGQGSTLACLSYLQARPGLRTSVLHALRTKPALCVCLGLQMMTRGTHEGMGACLGIMDGFAIPLPHCTRVPNVGWRTVRLTERHRVMDGLPARPRFYFAHSYFVSPGLRGRTIAVAVHGGLPFPSVVVSDNIVATQFHPERSSRDGMALCANFLRWKP
ncbi:Imidazole glycerol phosphate synthase subunit HisH 1 [Candidatus Tremblaya princeps]|uniref:Imidazole glycerol phosphate synthase subunit HisH 1 n=1 Tax=Tremblaya princeps TaxID=189385 RepID=A0A143WP19_TREPR|nr:Imidazole glycerol phosphate synthase subunit HisH 1 [Candidatus Tremblaya princeps]